MAVNAMMIHAAVPPVRQEPLPPDSFSPQLQSMTFHLWHYDLFLPFFHHLLPLQECKNFSGTTWLMPFNMESIFYQNLPVCLSKYKMLKPRYICVKYMQQLSVRRTGSSSCHGVVIFVQEFFKSYV